MVNGRPTNQGKWWAPNKTGKFRIRKPPANSMVAATACTANLKYGPTVRRSSYTPSRKINNAGNRIVPSLPDEHPKSRPGHFHHTHRPIAPAHPTETKDTT